MEEKIKLQVLALIKRERRLAKLELFEEVRKDLKDVAIINIDKYIDKKLENLK